MRDVFDYAIFLALLFAGIFALGRIFNGPLWIAICLLFVAVWLWAGYLIFPKIDHRRNLRRIQRGIADYLRGQGKE